jgi:hypothetical protein
MFNKYTGITIEKLKSNIDYIILSLSATTLGSIIIYYVVKSSNYVRYYGDDYCTSSVLNKIGYFEAQIYWYSSWSGRFSYNAFVHFSEIFYLNSIIILPIILCCFLIISLSFLFIKIINTKNTINIIISTIAAILFTGMMIILSPNIYQTLYWQTGSLTYFIPFIFLTAALALPFDIKNNTKSKNFIIKVIVFSILIFIAGGFSESYVAMQTTLLILILGALIIKKINKKKIIIFIYGTLSSIASMAIILLAPGNKVRQDLLPESQPIFEVIKNTIFGVMDYFKQILNDPNYVASIALLIIVGIIFAFISKNKRSINNKNIILEILYIIFSVICLVASIYGPGWLALSSNPPERTQFLAIYPVLLCSLILGVSIGFYYRSIRVSSFQTGIRGSIIAISLLMIVNLMNFSIITGRETLENIMTYSYAWEIQVESINYQKEKGENDLIIEWIIPLGELPDPQESSEGWVNVCMSRFHNVNTIKATNKLY